MSIWLHPSEQKKDDSRDDWWSISRKQTSKVHRVLGILQGMHMDLQKSILFPMTDLFTCNYNANDMLGKIKKKKI